MSIRTLRQSHRGSALAEFAITIPILLAVLLGIFEFARAWNVQQVITNAAREGARVAVVGASVDSVTKVVESRLAATNITATQIDVTLGAFSGDDDIVTVSVDYPYQLFGKVIGFLGGSGGATSVTLSSTSVMRHE